jgi:hypothetical protein
MQASVSGGTSSYVQDNSPTAETSYHARFYVNPNSATVNTTPLTLFRGLTATGSTVFGVQLVRYNGIYAISLTVTRSNGVRNTTDWYMLTNNAFNAVEIGWQSSSSASVSLSIGGTLKQTLTGLNTSASTLEAVRLGPQGSLSGVSGTMYFDSFVSTRTTVIGP